MSCLRLGQGHFRLADLIIRARFHLYRAQNRRFETAKALPVGLSFPSRRELIS